MDAKGFEDYIIRTIVDTVDYDAEKNAYIVNNVSINDDIISRIIQEAKRYDIDETTARQTITQLALSIKVNAIISIEQGSVHVKDIKQGQIFILYFRDERYGRLRVELMSLNTCSYYLVLSSDISGLQFGDVLKSKNSLWSHSFAIDFNISRNRKAFPESNTYISISKFEAIEYYNPTHVHEVLDKSIEKSTSSLLSIYDIVELTALFVDQNFSRGDYDMLLKNVVSSGLSSFHLNTIIVRVKEAAKDKKENYQSKEYSHADISSFTQICQVPIIKIKEKKVVETKIVVEKEQIKVLRHEWGKYTWGGFLFLIVGLVGVLWELGVLRGENIHLSRENAALTNRNINYESKLVHIKEVISTPLLTLPSWRSTNHKDGSESHKEYVINISKGDLLSFNYNISSEVSYDYLLVYVEEAIMKDKKLIFRMSGENKSGKVSYVFDCKGPCTIDVKYVKDGSYSRGLDKAEIFDICVYSSEKYMLEQIERCVEGK